jgi:3-hydroxybutyryl-CoA dehydrogenase
MGLMGTSIAACLLAAGHRIQCVEPKPERRKTARSRLLGHLTEARAHGLVRSSPAGLIGHASISGDFRSLQNAAIVIESTVEDLIVKREVLKKIEEVVSARVLIGSNTSAIPVTELQAGTAYPERILGLHWAEPAHVTRFMEVICGKATSLRNALRVMRLARHWHKEPSLLRKDIRGFITNRIMYAMIREAFYLVESGHATVADVDRSLRNDLGYWITFAGPFRFMDITGIGTYATVMEDLLPDLDRSTKVPQLMRKAIRSGARGVSNAKGFYRYTPAQARRWEKLFLQFSYEIRALAGKYPEDIGDRGPRRRPIPK